jgi:TRAP-type uncharacterized transport system substrate-binding protein
MTAAELAARRAAFQRALRSALLSVRDALVSGGPLVLLAVGLLVAAYWWLNPTPPKQVRMATGPAQSAYAGFGERYKAALEADGFEVVLVPSQGSQDNERLLREGAADLAFVQGGTAGDGREPDPGLQSLGSLFVEPLWIFWREDAARALPDGRLQALPQLQGLRVNVGTEGSGVPRLMARLFEANGVEPRRLRLSRLEQTPATAAFLAGRLDVLVFASAPESLMVQMLLRTPGVRLLDMPQAEAYARRLPFLTPVVLPRGIVDLAADRPREDVRLVATTTALLAREDTHPAVLQRAALAARELHGQAGWFQRAREFPTVAHSEFPVAREAERTYADGPGLLHRWLPFWVANLVERMWLALGLILAVLLPLSRVVPPLYALRIRSRVYRWYAQLRAIEDRAEAGEADVAALDRELEVLDNRVSHVPVPLSYADELYALRSAIALVRQRLQAAPAGDGAVPEANAG